MLILLYIRNVLNIMIVLTIFLGSPEAVLACQTDTITVEAFGKTLPVQVKGKGNGVPMLIVGPATLFNNGLLPKQLYDHFIIYFVDFCVETDEKDPLNVASLTLDDFVTAIEGIRKHLNIAKMVLFGHSTNGILALRYSEKYPMHVIANILVGTPPFNGPARRAFNDAYFAKHAPLNKQLLYAEDQAKLTNNATFIEKYNAKRAFNFFEPNAPGRENIWGDIRLDETLVNRFFALIENFDLREDPEIVKVPIFLGLGEQDFTCPSPIWTEDSKEVLQNRLITYHIFANSAHYPMIENATTFAEQLLLFFNKVWPNRNQKTIT